MRALIQRVTKAAVVVDGVIIGSIDAGLLILVCAMPDDDEATGTALASKISKLRPLDPVNCTNSASPTLTWDLAHEFQNSCFLPVGSDYILLPD